MTIIGILLDMAGTVMIGVAALRVHHNVLRDKMIDEKVFRTMRIERVQGYAGIALVCIGNMLVVVHELV